MNNDTVKRYIYAVSCHLPAKAQPEVEREVEGMIADMLEARLNGAEATEEDILAVLTELGSPEELAVKYSGDESKALISGIYFLWFKKVIKFVLPIAAIASAFAVLISGFARWQAPQEMYELIPELIGEMISSAIGAAMQAALWVGLVFAVLERKKVKFSDEEFLTKLRPVPDKRAQIKAYEPIMNIFWSIAAAVLFLGFSNIIGAYSQNIGWIPVFDQGYIRSVWYLVGICTALSIAKEVIKLRDGRYSKRLAITTGAANLIYGTCAAVFFGNGRIMNAAFRENVGSLLEGVKDGKLAAALENINFVLLAVIVFVMLLEIGATMYRAFRYDK